MLSFDELPTREAVLDQISAIFRERIIQRAAPGIRFAVFDAGGIIHEGGFGDAGTPDTPPSPHVRFRVASCTKSFTAAAVLLLRDRGLLSLDSPVTQFVTALTATLPSSLPEAPTIRMLLSMAGGLPTDDPWADRQESLTNDAFNEVLRAGVRFSTIPGTRYEYSNLGYALLGQVIEAVSGCSYQAFVTENLLMPLGLDETGFDPMPVNPEMRATGYRKANDQWLPQPLSGPGAFSAIGGAITTTGDLARWAGWLSAAFAPDATNTGPLRAASRREMQSIQCPMVCEPDEDLRLKGYGYGLIIEQYPRFGVIVSHSGGYPGFSSHMRWSTRTGLGVLAFENATYSGAWLPTRAALDALLDAAATPTTPEIHPPLAVRELADGVVRLLVHGWDNTTADAIFLENVVMDRPYCERAKEFSALLERAGAPVVSDIKISPADDGGAEGGFGHFRLHIPFENEDVTLLALCGPTMPMKIQSLEIE